MQAKVLVYSLEEIVAKKLWAILQHPVMPKERGWNRSRARDYYEDRMELAHIEFLFQKYDIRVVSFGLNSFLYICS